MNITMEGNLVCTLSKKNELFKMHLIKSTNTQKYKHTVRERINKNQF